MAHDQEGADRADVDPLDRPVALFDEVAAVIPRLFDRTRAQAGLLRRLAALLPCIGSTSSSGNGPPVPDDDTHGAVDVLAVVALGDDEVDEGPHLSGATVDGPGPPPADDGPAGSISAGVPTESELGVQDYDSLAASQVVPRLVALSPPELDAVEHYERAHRNRQTILNKVKQLRAR